MPYPSGATLPGASLFPGGATTTSTIESDPVEITLAALTAVQEGPSSEIFLDPIVGAPATPSIPTGLAATAVGAGFVTLDWADSTGMITGDGYDVAQDGVVLVSGLVTSGYTVTGLVDGVSHTYQVRAGSTGRYTVFSASITATSQSTATAAPSVPTNLIITGTGDGTVSLGWTSSTGMQPGDTYEISMDSVIVLQGITSPAVTVNGLVNGVLHTFAVRAGSTGRFSALSTSVTGAASQSTASPPSIPTGLIAPTVTSNTIILDWVDSTGMQVGDFYEVTRNGTTVATGLTSSTYTNTGLTAGTQYVYQVRAGAAGRFSAYSTSLTVTTSTVTTPPPPLETPEQWTINGLSLINPPTLWIELPFEMPPPKQRQNWIGGADSERQVLLENPRHENRVLSGTLFIAPQSTKDQTLVLLAQVTQQFQAASQTSTGVPLVWKPRGSSASYTFFVLAAEFTDFQLDEIYEGRALKVPFSFTCDPYLRGTESVSPAVTAAAPVITSTVTVPGNVPALARIIVKDAANQARRYVELGVENRNFLPSSPTSLIIDSSAMQDSAQGYTGTKTSVGLTGFYTAAGGTSSGITGLAPGGISTVLCGVPAQSHNGRFRVKARVTSSNASRPTIRLAWQIGTGQTQINRWREFQPSGIRDVDLGVIDVPAGQSWSGHVDVYDQAGVGAGTISLDYLKLIPADGGYVKAQTQRPGGGSLLAFDAFNDMASNTLLGGRSVPLGGAWTTLGAGFDFNAQIGVGAVPFGGLTTSPYISMGRGATGARYALLGGTYGDVVASGYLLTTGVVNVAVQQYGFMVRYVNTTNYVWAGITTSADPLPARFVLVQVLNGVSTVLDSRYVGTWPNQAWWNIWVSAYTSGGAYALLIINGASVATLGGASNALATGGALATGRVGIIDDESNLANDYITRYYDSFQASTVSPEVVLSDSTRSIQFASDDVTLIGSNGAQIGRPPSDSGARIVLQPGTNRIAVSARRQDVDTGTDDGISDSTTLQVAYTPRYLIAPPGS